MTSFYRAMHHPKRCLAASLCSSLYTHGSDAAALFLWWMPMVFASLASGGQCTAAMIACPLFSLAFRCSVFELYHSLGGTSARYTYDMYTYHRHVYLGETRAAVGLTEGLVAHENYETKCQRVHTYPSCDGACS